MNSRNSLNSLNWPRIILCGLITGVVYTLLTAVLVGRLGGEFLATTAIHTSTGETLAKGGPGLYLITVFTGLWAMWLYAVIRPQASGKLVAVAKVSLAWWIIAGLQSIKWILLLEIPLSAWLPLATNLIPTVIAVLVGSTFFGDG